MGRKKGDDAENNALVSFQYSLRNVTMGMLTLRLLSGQPMYAYQILQELARRSGDSQYTDVGPYQMLYALEDEGYIHIYGIELVKSRSRKIYEITSSGEELLEKMRAAYEHSHQIVASLLGVENQEETDV